MAVKTLEIRPLEAPSSSAVDFGAEIYNADIEHLTDEDFEVIRNALYNSLVVVIKNQAGLSPKAQYELTRRFDPASDSYGHGKTLDAKRSVLHPDLKTIPHQPQVQVIGNGFYEEYEGLKNITLVHPHHKKFHESAIPDEEDLNATRFYRWHIDAALYALNPPKVTSLMAVKVPAGRRQTLRYDDGTGEEMDVPLGTTAFVSGQNRCIRAFLARRTRSLSAERKVEYAPHPYVWMSSSQELEQMALGMISDGIGAWMLSELPPVDETQIKILPMCWKNPVTGKLALQIHPIRHQGHPSSQMARVMSDQT